MKRNAIIFILVTIAVITMSTGIYFISFSKALKEANLLYDKGLYIEALNRIQKFETIGSDANRIKYAGYAMNSFFWYNEYVCTSGILYNEPNYEKGFIALVGGLKLIDNDKIMIIKSTYIEDKIKAKDDVRKVYIDELHKVYGVNEDYAIELIGFNDYELFREYTTLEKSGSINKR